MQDIGQASALKRWFFGYLNHGVDSLAPEDRRYGRMCNAAAMFITFAFAAYGALYGLEDWRALWLVSLFGFLGAALCLPTPLLLRRQFLLGVCWLWGASVAILTANAFLLGRDTGVQILLYASASALTFLILGPNRLALALLMISGSIGLAIAVEIWGVQPIPPVRVDPGFQQFVRISILAQSGFTITGFLYYALWRMNKAEKALAAEHARSERLLDNLLPEKIAARLKDEPDQIIADEIGQTTILFADIVDFTPRAASMAPEQLVRFLNGVFTAFDAETDARGLEKIKTIGDAYMVAAGMPEPRADHAAAIADMALKMLEITERLSAETGQPVSVRVGVHTGPAVAGVIGTRKFFYDVWGDTVNTAARMESHGEPGRIQVTAETRAALGDAYAFEPRGAIDIKGKGLIETWWLTGRRGDGEP